MTLRARVRRSAHGVLAAGLVVVLLSTAAFAGHQVTHHDAHLQPCAVCAAVAHTPITTTSAPALGAPTVVVDAVVSSTFAAPPARVRSIARGRSPPLPSALPAT